MNLFALSGLLNLISSFIFGFFIYFKDRKNRVFQLWLAFSLAVVIWEFGVFKIGSTTTDERLSLFWWRIAYIGVILIPVFFSNFIYAWLKIKRKFYYYFSWAFGVFFLALNLSDIFFNTTFFIPRVRWVFNSFYYNVPQPLYNVFVVLWFFMVLYAHYELVRIYRNSTGSKRSQIQYFLFAFLAAYAGGGTCYLVVYNINFYPYFNFTAPFYPIIMSYAIVVHRLMDIKLVMRKYSVYLSSLSVIVLFAIGIKYWFDRYLPLYTDWADFFILLSAISVFLPIKNYFYHLANRYFFSSLYDARQVIVSLSDKLRSTLEVKKIYQFISDTLTNAFHVKALGILNYDEKNQSFGILYNQGFNTFGQSVFPNDPELFKLFLAQGESVIVEELKQMHYEKHKFIIDLLMKLKVEIITPLNLKDKTIGLIVLGAKESGDMYNEEDLQVLKAVGAQAAIAIENALLYDESKKFGIKLEEEVKKATKDLKRANAQLKKLDQAKSDFISIASHQLRTPLTVIKGYISMILEGNFGELTDGEKDSLEKIYESNERLINLVENLLNISRIESGRLQFDFKQVDLHKMAASVVEELSGNAKKKNLILEYQPPVKPLPKLKLDEEKIRQVAMNLIDNAIKYTKQGSITVTVEQNKKSVRFCVADSGMGIKPDDMPNLFKKFSRGRGTTLIHTEGTGLGLYVARMMIDAHQGRIWAESDGPGKGSKFCFELPIK